MLHTYTPDDNTEPCGHPNDINCCDGTGLCKFKPMIQIEDNWGWCNGGKSENMCSTSRSTWASFDNLIIIQKQK
jgi:hypothetical protein